MDIIQPISTFIYALLYSYCLLNLYKLIHNLAVFIISAFKERTHSLCLPAVLHFHMRKLIKCSADRITLMRTK